MTDIATLGIKVDSTQVPRAANDLEKLATSARKAETATEAVARASASASAQVTRQNQVVQQVTRITGGANFNVANLAAQFQDVGVSAAMSMNPLQIALQQGTQISAVLGPMGAAGALKSLGAAFLSVISPVSLVVIGIVALVAAGLQLVNWAGVAKGVLNGLANVLALIAPYAAMAAAGIALLYAPTIIAGVVNLIGWLGRLSVSALIAAASLAAANPGVAFVLGVTAAVAAAVIFRDELKQIFGRDIVEDAKNGVNWIIGAFVGGFNAIKLTWKQLPAVLGDVAITTANNVIRGVQSMINGAIGLMNGLIDRANSITGKVGIKLGNIGEVDFGKVANPFEGAAADAAKTIGAEMAAAQKNDWAGQFVSGVGKAASAAADKLQSLAASMAGVDKNAEKLAKKYDGIVRDANQFIASQRLEAETVGMTAEAANELRYEQDLLNKAQDAGIKLTSGQKNELSGLAQAMALAQSVATKLRDAFDFTKDVIKGFASDFTSSLRNGESVWNSFANAGLNALQKISDKLLDMALDQAINGLFKNLLGPLFGGLFGGGVLSGGTALGMGGIGHNALGNAFRGGNVIPFARGGVVNRPTLFPMANGAGLMGEAGPEGILPLRRGPGGRLGVEGGGGGAVIEVRVSVDESGNIVPLVNRIAGNVANVRVEHYRRNEAARDFAKHKNTSLIETGARVA